MDLTEITKDNITKEPIKRGRGRPRKEEHEKIVKQDRTEYMHNYCINHYTHKPRIKDPLIRYGRHQKQIN